MDWTQALTIVGTQFATGLILFLWNRSEANADRRNADAKFERFEDKFERLHKEIMSHDRRMTHLETKEGGYDVG